MRYLWIMLSGALLSTHVFADGPRDNEADQVRPVPPPGIKLSDSDRAQFKTWQMVMGVELMATQKELENKPALRELVPDARVFHKAAEWAVTYNEFFSAKEVTVFNSLFKEGRERFQALRQGKAPWATAHGLIVRGYESKIDGSVQPYGLVVPASFNPNSEHRHRLDIWFHGRGETLSELNFIDGRQKSAGEFTPPDALVLHLYGRYCNANKFAGEIDLFEALEHVRKHYRIDENRIVVRGFSMGGAACWQFAAHYPSMWTAAAPGAGFSETADFLRVFQDEKLTPTWYERKLWHLYDCTDYAVNLFNCPTVAYSGEIDKQKQAADVMAKALKEEGISLVHIIGPKTGHSYHPEAKKEVNRRIDSIVAHGRDPLPRRVRFTTWTLRYNQSAWVRIDGLEEHWERARVDAEITDANTVKVKTLNVSDLALIMSPGLCPLDITKPPQVLLGNDAISATPVLSDRSWVAHFTKKDGHWQAAPSAAESGLHKRHGLQGPIDDAFMSGFLMVRPTGKALNEKVGAWTAGEMKHATEHWRSQFRGDAPVKDDEAVNEADIANKNLILWGDPSSNTVLARIADKLPIRWNANSIELGSHNFPATDHVALLIYPNPLNPKRYVVLNSGFTFREYDYLNNARQVPKLPDYAIVDVTVPPSSRLPGKIATAGFFGERWELKEESKK